MTTVKFQSDAGFRRAQMAGVKIFGGDVIAMTAY